MTAYSHIKNSDNWAELTYHIEKNVLHVRAKNIWCLQDDNKNNYKKISHIQDEIHEILQAKKVNTLFLEYHAPKDNNAEKLQKKQNSSLKNWDSLLLACFTSIIDKAKKSDISVNYSHLPKKMLNLLSVELLASDKEVKPDNSILYNIGDAALDMPIAVLNASQFLGEVVVAFWHFFRGKSSCSARDIWQEIYTCSAASLPIISLVSLLLGLILAFVSALQLKTLGAELYVASLVSISMVRVMGPVLTGIVVAGRTGASYAATIGSMQVNEEVDALTTFGISPIEFLIVPKVLALTLMMPLLTMYSNAMGILGGFLVAVFGMDISPQAFIENVQFMANISSLWIGLFHAFVFGFVIALASCYQGLICGRNAEAVGKATTASVVNSIVAIIVTTSIITILLSLDYQ